MPQTGVSSEGNIIRRTGRHRWPRNLGGPPLRKPRESFDHTPAGLASRGASALGRTPRCPPDIILITLRPRAESQHTRSVAIRLQRRRCKGQEAGSQGNLVPAGRVSLKLKYYVYDVGRRPRAHCWPTMCCRRGRRRPTAGQHLA